jgi:hypothetical protein
MRDQIVVFRFIRDSFPDRPIYFTMTGTSYPADLGLEPYVVTQGLVRKLLPAPVHPTEDTIRLGDQYLDVTTTYALWSRVYQAPRALLHDGTWIDRASVGVPYVYAALGIELAQALEARGDRQGAEQVAATVNAIGQAARLDRF